MKEFIDENGNKVVFSFSSNPAWDDANHVLVICSYGDSWLLTNHKKRGLEFPGGKKECGETLEDAARREVYEETGAILGRLERIGEYKVFEPNGSFVKAVFWGKVRKIENTDTYFETNGPVVVEGDLLQLRFGQPYSFIMKDQVIEECLTYIQGLQDKKE